MTTYSMSGIKYINLLQKLGIGLLINTVVFVLIVLTIDTKQDSLLFSTPNLFYFITAFFFLILSWEVTDRLIKKQLEVSNQHGLDWWMGLVILGKSLAVVLPVFALVYYLAAFHYSQALCIVDENPWRLFLTDFLRAALISVTVTIFDLFYFAGKVKDQLIKKMVELQNELATSKYKSLKDQVSPHFLFNSLNTLTGLMYEDRDLASDFVSRLSSCYRYLLQTGEEDLVRLDKELAFLDSYMFMMQVRHKDALSMSVDEGLNPKDFLIPTLSLQIIVENALKHNYFSLEHPLKVRVFLSADQGIVVENTLRKRSDSMESTKMGLENIKRRFSFYTSKPVLVEENEGIFRVTIPLLERKKSMRLITQS